jgi:predicted transcriptional regulator
LRKAREQCYGEIMTSSADLVPADLVPAIESAAAEEHRTPRELVGEALERYLSERRYFRKDEVHDKIARGLESLRQGKGLDGEAVMDELLAELDAPRTAHPRTTG